MVKLAYDSPEMGYRLFCFVIGAMFTLEIDQFIKSFFLDGFRLDGECISLILAFNKGVAFSMFESLGESLKYIQIALLCALGLYALLSHEIARRQVLFFGIIVGAGASNVYDRFLHGGVVDYVYWHCGFDFAIFNFADVMIDVSIAVIILMYYLEYRQKKDSREPI